MSSSMEGGSGWCYAQKAAGRRFKNRREKKNENAELGEKHTLDPRARQRRCASTGSVVKASPRTPFRFWVLVTTPRPLAIRRLIHRPTIVWIRSSTRNIKLWKEGHLTFRYCHRDWTKF